MTVTIEENERALAVWQSLMGDARDQLQAAFPDQGVSTLFLECVSGTLAWALRTYVDEEQIVAGILNRLLADCAFGPETGWRLVRAS